MLQKVKILLNKVDWDIQEQLQAVKDYYSSKVTLEFRTIETSHNIPWDDKEFDFISQNWLLKNIVDDDSDIYVIACHPDDYKRSGTLAYSAFVRLLDKKLIVMGVEPGTTRTRNRGWANDDYFAGTLRHELAHIFYQLAYVKDRTHEFDYEQKNFDLILETLPWGLVEKNENEEGKYLHLPMPDTRKTGYRYLQITETGIHHPGLDINWGKDGYDDNKYPVVPMYYGNVVYVGRDIPGWGNLVVIEHPQLGVWTRYGHLDKVFVKVGDSIISNHVFGRCGGTSGRAKPYVPHVHFEVIKQRLANWASYTNGMNMQEVMNIWADPEEYIAEQNKIIKEKSTMEQWKQQALDWAKKNGVSNGERPEEAITRVEAMEMIRKYHERFNG